MARPVVARAAAVALVAALIAAASTGCASSRPGSIQYGDHGDRLHVAQVGSAQPGRGRPIRVEPVASPPVNAVEWDVVRLDPRSRQVHIQWADGFSPQCGEEDRAQVEETDHAIIIGLGSTYSGPPANCAAYAVPRSRTVTLGAPIGTRSLLESVPAGVNADYSPVTDPDRLPVPRQCLRGGEERNAPVGALDVADRMVPFIPTRALICSVDPRVPQRVLTAAPALAELTADVDAGRPLRIDERGFPASCPDDRSVFFDLYLSDASAVVQVHIGERGCLEMTNGVRTTTVPDALVQRLERLTRS